MNEYACCIHCDHDPGYVHQEDCLSCVADDESEDLNWWPDDE